MTDPLTPLVRALAHRVAPPLDWVLEWSRDGRDPVAVAWEASRWQATMVNLLSFAGARAAYRAAYSAWRRNCLTEGSAHHMGRGCVRCCAAIRRVVPVPPTLPELLAQLSSTLERSPAP